MAKSDELVSREELLGIIKLAMIVAALVVGREVGGLYASFNEVKAMTVIVDARDEDLSAYLRGALGGADTDLRFRLGVSLPGTRFSEGQVVKTPDYVRRWLIGVTLSPILVQQPEVGSFEVALLVEGEEVARDSFTFPREKVGYLSTLSRQVALRIPDRQRLQRLVAASAGSHGGEAQVTLRGRALASLLWLEEWLPFESTRHTLVEPPRFSLLDHGWGGLAGPVQSVKAGDATFVTVKLGNPARIHTFSDNVTCAIYRTGEPQPVFEQVKLLSVAPGTDATYFFQFTPLLPGEYTYTLSGKAGIAVKQGESRRLTVNP